MDPNNLLITHTCEHVLIFLWTTTGRGITLHNSTDSVQVCIKEVAIRTTFSHMFNIAGIIFYTCSLVIDIQCTRYKRLKNSNGGM